MTTLAKLPIGGAFAAMDPGVPFRENRSRPFEKADRAQRREIGVVAIEVGLIRIVFWMANPVHIFLHSSSFMPEQT